MVKNHKEIHRLTHRERLARTTWLHCLQRLRRKLTNTK